MKKQVVSLLICSALMMVEGVTYAQTLTTNPTDSNKQIEAPSENKASDKCKESSTHPCKKKDKKEKEDHKCKDDKEKEDHKCKDEKKKEDHKCKEDIKKGENKCKSPCREDQSNNKLEESSEKPAE